MADAILLGTDDEAKRELKGLFRYANTSSSDAGFANRYLYFPYGLQSKNW